MVRMAGVALGCMALCTASCFADTVLGTTSNGLLYSIIPATGQEALVGTLRSSGSSAAIPMYDIAANGNSVYSIDLNGTLYSVNPNTAQTTRIGVNPGLFINALTFGNGVLYGAGRDSLYTINTNTGLATLVGNGTANGGTAYNSSGDVSFINGKLYLTSFNGNGTNDSFFTIDPATGKGTEIDTLSFGTVFALAYSSSDQTLYGFTDPSTNVTGSGQVLIINPNTGVATAHTSYVVPFFGATEFNEVPEPATIGLMLVGLGAFLVVLARRRA